MREIDKKRKHSSGEPSGIGLFAKKPRTSSEFTDLEISLVTGDSHTFLYIKVDGEDKLYASGKNNCGQLGLGDETQRNKWTEVTQLGVIMIEKVMAGGLHSILIGKDKDGNDKLYACGRNFEGQLGLGHNEHRDKWTKVPFPKGFTIENVLAGGDHSFLQGKGKDGEDKIYASGSNMHGQLGLGNFTKRTEWTEVTLPRGFSVEKVLVGDYHSILKGKGKNGEDKLYASGSNHFGQLGLGDTTDRDQWTEVDIPQGFRLEKALVGSCHSILKGKSKDGEDKLYACGYNLYGQLGLGDKDDRNEWTAVPLPRNFTIQKVMAGGSHSFLKGKGKDGEDKLYASGYNYYGQLGLGDTKDRDKWTEVTQPEGFTIEKVLGGYGHSILKGKGKGGEDKLYASGWNNYGQLGLGDTKNRDKWTEVPIADLIKKSQKDVNDRKQEDDVSEASGSSSFSMGLNPRDCIF